MCRTVKENMLERVSIHFFEAEEKLDGLVGITDLLNSIDLLKKKKFQLLSRNGMGGEQNVFLYF